MYKRKYTKTMAFLDTDTNIHQYVIDQNSVQNFIYMNDFLLKIDREHPSDDHNTLNAIKLYLEDTSRNNSSLMYVRSDLQHIWNRMVAKIGLSEMERLSVSKRTGSPLKGYQLFLRGNTTHRNRSLNSSKSLYDDEPGDDAFRGDSDMDSIQNKINMHQEKEHELEKIIQARKREIHELLQKRKNIQSTIHELEMQKDALLVGTL
jgi:hypothetical protein